VGETPGKGAVMPSRSDERLVFPPAPTSTAGIRNDQFAQIADISPAARRMDQVDPDRALATVQKRDFCTR